MRRRAVSLRRAERLRAWLPVLSIRALSVTRALDAPYLWRVLD